MNHTLQDIEKSCTKLAAARADLAVQLAALQAEIDAARKARIVAIRRLSKRAHLLHCDTLGLVRRSAHLFKQPKSITLSGIKVGFQKGKGRVEIPDEELTIERIRKLLPDTASNYIQISESPIKSEIGKLPAAMLKRIQATLVEGQDEPIVRPQDSDLDKLCARLTEGLEP